MRQKQDDRGAVEKAVREIKRRTRRRFSPEDKIRIVLQGLRGEDSIAELCRREGLHQNQYYRWSKEFLEAGRKRLEGAMKRVRYSIRDNDALALAVRMLELAPCDEE